MVVERVAHTPLILAGAYDTHDSMSPVNDELSHGTNENSLSHRINANSESANLNDYFCRFPGLYLDHGAKVRRTDQIE